VINKLIKILRTPFEIAYLGSRNEDYDLAYGLFFAPREAFISDRQFGNTVMVYYGRHGSAFRRWFVSTYGLIVAGITILFLFLGPIILGAQNNPMVVFYVRCLSPLVILMFFASSLRAMLYQQQRLALAGFASTVANLCNFSCLFLMKFFPVRYCLVLSQLLYSGIQVIWMFFCFKEEEKTTSKPLLSAQKAEFHKIMALVALSTSISFLSNLTRNFILYGYRGAISLVKYAYRVIFLFMELLGLPLSEILGIKLSQAGKGNAEQVKKYLVLTHIICIFPIFFLYFSGSNIVCSYLGKINNFGNAGGFVKTCKVLSFMIYPLVLNNICNSGLSAQGKNLHQVGIKLVHSIIEIALIYLLLKFSGLPSYLAVVTGSTISVYLKLFLSLLRFFGSFSLRDLGLFFGSTTIALLVNYLFKFLGGLFLSPSGILAQLMIISCSLVSYLIFLFVFLKMK
jgi:peptidoglycan biosynthesis protein MviN/MurJ (putative lipid II flippase)